MEILTEADRLIGVMLLIPIGVLMGIIAARSNYMWEKVLASLLTVIIWWGIIFYSSQVIGGLDPLPSHLDRPEPTSVEPKHPQVSNPGEPRQL